MTSLKDFDYEDIRVIGRGQYGKAHLVKHTKDQTSYIAKTIDLTCLSKKERETALQEVELLRRLDHPNIVEYRDNFFMGETLVIVMQYCEGGDLTTYIKESSKRRQYIREAQIMHYFVQVLQALEYIHSKRILHRDLKTSNLFLTNKAQLVKLGDFGISRVLEGSIEAAITVVGTPYYMSPEVCENKPYTFKSDVWSLGCVLYELCMLKHAFSADNLLGLVYKIVSDNYEAIPKGYSKDLNSLIQRILTKSSERRPSVQDLLSEPFVQRFMTEYVRTSGQCATPAARSAPGGGAAGRAPRAAVGASRGSGSGAGVAATGSTGSAGGSRPSRQPRLVRPARTASGGERGTQETPKEAVARRKREAADKKAEELKAATREAANKTSVARDMKKAEFQTTRPVAGMVAASSTAPTWRPGGTWRQGEEGVSAPEGAPEAWTQQQQRGSFGEDSGNALHSDEDLEDVEEIYSEAESAESYEDDFEDDVYTEDELPEELDGYNPSLEVGHLSTVREEQDFTRVMSNYKQDLARGPSGAMTMEPRGTSPSPVGGGGFKPSFERTASGPGEAASPPGARSTTSAGTSGGGGGFGGVLPACGDMRTRANRLREELMRKMGAETFQKTFDYLLAARQQNRDERAVRRELEALVGRDTYKMYCFDVDQLVFHQQVYNR